MFRLLTRITHHFLLFGLIIIAVILTAIRILVFCIDLYKHELEYHFSGVFAAPVKIGQLSAKMHRLYPEIILKNITLSQTDAPKKTAITLKELRLGVDLLDVVMKRQLIGATRLSLIGAKLSVIRKKDGSFMIAGLRGDDSQPLWLLQGDRYQLLDSEISWQDEKRDGKMRHFKHVDLVISNDASKNRHQIHLLSQLPPHYGNRLRVSVDIRGNVFEPDSLDGRLYVEGEGIKFAQFLTDELPLKLGLKRGSADFKLWGELKKSELAALGGEIKARDLDLQRQDGKKLIFNSVKGTFDWQGLSHDWKLAIKDLQFKEQKTGWQSASFTMKLKSGDDSRLAANIKHLDLQLANRVGHFFWPLFAEKTPTWLEELTLKGRLQDALLFVDRKHYALKANFKKLSVAAGNDFPELKNFSGSIEGTEQGGSLLLDTANASVRAKGVFRQRLEISKLHGRLDWEQFCEEWSLSAKNLQLDTPYLRSRHQLSLRIPKDELPAFIDLRTAFYDVKDVSKLKRYFPINTMGKDTVAWLDRAFVSGNIRRGDMLLYGNVDDFPFEKKQGVFQVLFTPRNLELAYAEDWPNLKSMTADVMFLNEGLDIVVKRAKAGKVTVTNALVKIPSLESSDYLTAKIKATGAVADAVAWMQKTPLDLSLDEVKEQISVSGNTRLSADLKIPLTDDGVAKVDGSAKLNRAALKVKSIDLPVTRIKGTLRFTESRFFARNLQAAMLGYPVRINIKDSDAAMSINVNGKTDAKRLWQHFELPLEFASGASDYELRLNLPYSTADASLKIDSMLEGIRLELPATLAKQANERKPLSITMPLNERPLQRVTLSYGQDLKAKLKIDKEKTALHSGNVLLGAGTVSFPEKKGVNVSVELRSFAALPWLAILGDGGEEDEGDSLIRELLIDTPNLKWGKANLGAFKLRLKQEESRWNGDIDSTFAKGKLHLAKDSYRLDMDSINLSALAKLEGSGKGDKKIPKKLPLLNIRSERLLWRGVNLGSLNLASKHYGNDIHFDEIKVKSGEHELSLTGNWRVKNGGHYTQLQGHLKAEKFGELLKRLDLSDELKETAADITLALNWNLAPHEFSLAALNGEIALELKDGRISSIEPGFGRVLGVLAVAQWIKRLQLDFGDIYKEGLTFDSIKGHYYLQNGTASSDDLVVDAVPAKITLKGKLNLGKKTLDKEISVIPKSSAALPIAGTIVGGIATAIAQTVTGEYEEGFYLRTKYRVQGKWKQLKVTPLHEQDGLLQKTWRGLTDFSWINEQEQQDETDNE